MQNTRQDILASVRSIYGHGIDVIAGFIVGFDNDTVETFERQRSFITNSGIQSAMIGLLTALPKTPLYKRLAKENRLIAADALADNTRARTNIIPKQMTREQLIGGYRDLHNKLFSDRGIADRVRNKLRYMHRPGYGAEYTTLEIARLLWRFVVRALIPGGWRRTALFLRTMPLTRPRTIPLAISDWVVGLSMRDYVDRNFAHEFQEDTRLVRRYVDAMKSAFHDHRNTGALGVSIREFQNRAAAVAITMNGRIQPTSFGSVSKSAARLLRNTPTGVTPDTTGRPPAQAAPLARARSRCVGPLVNTYTRAPRARASARTMWADEPKPYRPRAPPSGSAVRSRAR